ncbi:hypothetical protein LINGRAHAP2_LOCUS2971 [Linum grandiflorum]
MPWTTFLGSSTPKFHAFSKKLHILRKIPATINSFIPPHTFLAKLVSGTNAFDEPSPTFILHSILQLAGCFLIKM